MVLPFKIVDRQGRAWKIRDDGRQGPAVGDEQTLWEALQASLAVQLEQGQLIDKLTGQLAEAEKELAARPAAIGGKRR